MDATGSLRTDNMIDDASARVSKTARHVAPGRSRKEAMPWDSLAHRTLKECKEEATSRV